VTPLSEFSWIDKLKRARCVARFPSIDNPVFTAVWYGLLGVNLRGVTRSAVESLNEWRDPCSVGDKICSSAYTVDRQRVINKGMTTLSFSKISFEFELPLEICFNYMGTLR